MEISSSGAQPHASSLPDPQAGFPQPPAQPTLSVGVRLAIYIPSVVIFSFLAILVLNGLKGIPWLRSPLPWLMCLEEAFLFTAVLVPASLLARLEHRSVADYGLPLGHFLARFWLGCALGLAEITLLIGCISVLGGYSFGSLALTRPGVILEWLLFWIVFFIVVGLYEEFAFRGYLQFTLTTKIGFWPAAWILSLSFGALHRLNGGENWVGAAGVAAAGLVFALALQRTGNLWFAIGWHAAFDFGETFLFSVPNSGIVLDGHLSNASLHGPAWLTGGSVGPEGSVFSFVILGLSGLLIHLVFPDRKYTAEQLAAPRDKPAA